MKTHNAYSMTPPEAPAVTSEPNEASRNPLYRHGRVVPSGEDLNPDYAIVKFRHMEAVEADPRVTLSQIVAACDAATGQDLVGLRSSSSKPAGVIRIACTCGRDLEWLSRPRMPQAHAGCPSHETRVRYS